MKKPARQRKPARLLGVEGLLQNGLYRDGSSFAIDEHISDLQTGAGGPVKLHTRWSSQLDPVWHGRRALEVASMQAENAYDSLAIGDRIQDWKGTGALAGRAFVALGAFLDGLAFHPTVADDAKDELTAEHIAKPLRTISVHVSCARGLDVPGRAKWAQERAQELLAAHKALELLDTCLKNRRSDLAKDRSNPGDPVKVAVVSTMAEAWVFLTGKLPGSGSARNPFLRFAEAAWEDLGGRPDESLIQALRAVLPAMKGNDYLVSDHYRPGWERPFSLPTELSENDECEPEPVIEAEKGPRAAIDRAFERAFSPDNQRDKPAPKGA